MWAYSLQNGEMNEKKKKEAKPYRTVSGHDGCSFVLCNAGNPQHFSSRYL